MVEWSGTLSSSPMHTNDRIERLSLAPADIRTVADVKKQAREVYGRLRPTIDKLKQLLGCDRSTFAPSIIAGHAQVLERELKALFDLLAGSGKES